MDLFCPRDMSRLSDWIGSIRSDFSETPKIKGFYMCKQCADTITTLCGRKCSRVTAIFKLKAAFFIFQNMFRQTFLLSSVAYVERLNI